MKTPEEKRAAHAAYQRKWIADNRERSREIARKTYWKNREKRVANALAYAASHRTEAVERATKWQQANRERRKAYMDKYYAANRDKFLKKTRDWNGANPERARAHRAAYSAWRRSLLGSMDKHATLACKPIVEREARKKVHRCYYCQKRFRGEFHFDHVIALARGGKHEPSNLAVSCPACNSAKQDKPVGSLVVKGQKLLNV